MRIVQKKQIGGGVYPSYYYNMLVNAVPNYLSMREASKNSSIAPLFKYIAEVTDLQPEGKEQHQRILGAKNMPILNISAQGDSLFYSPNSEWVDKTGYDIQPNSEYFPNVNNSNEKQNGTDPNVFRATVNRWNEAKKSKKIKILK